MKIESGERRDMRQKISERIESLRSDLEDIRKDFENTQGIRYAIRELRMLIQDFDGDLKE